MQTKISEALSQSHIKHLLESYCRSFGIGAAILNPQGEILIQANFQKICAKFHRIHPEGCKRCLESDTILGNKLKQCQSYAIYRCRNGLIDAASPVIVNDKHIASVYIGQFFTSPPDRNFFIRQAQQFGYDMDEYMAALDEIQVINSDMLRSILQFLVQFTSRVEENYRQQNLLLRSREQMRANSEVLKAIASYTNNWENWYGPDGTLLWVNPAAELISGFSAKVILAMQPVSPLPLIVEEDRARITAVLRQAVEGETTGQSETFRILTREKKICWLEMSWIPIYNTKGEKLGLRTSLNDITLRKEREAELSRMRSLLANTINSMPSMLIGINQEDRITQWNLTAQNLTGITEKEAEGKKLPELLPQFSGHMRDIHKTIKSRRPFYSKHSPDTEAGETRHEEITVFPLIMNGVQGAVIRVDDITSRVQMEEMMMQSEKMLSVGGMAAGMAHEINNPLAGILQNLQLVNVRLNQDNPKNREAAARCGTDMKKIKAYLRERGVGKHLDAIMDSGLRAARIVSNMLSFSRKKAQGLKPYDLRFLMNQTLALAQSNYDFREKFDFKNISIIRDYAEDMPQVRCEADTIEQVFLNIIKNATQAMADADTPNPSLNIKIALADGNARVEISNNGPAIKKEDLKNIFEPFFTTKNTDGTGLGLSVSYFIITQRHHGRLEISCAKQGWTSFIITLPLNGGGSPH